MAPRSDGCGAFLCACRAWNQAICRWRFYVSYGLCGFFGFCLQGKRGLGKLEPYGAYSSSRNGSRPRQAGRRQTRVSAQGVGVQQFCGGRCPPDSLIVPEPSGREEDS